jgi:Ca-activated chloride channel family protein
MTFLWPQALLLLIALPLLVALYFWLLARRKKSAVRYASIALVKNAIGAGSRIRRHVPPLLVLASLAAMILAVARPAAVITLPTQHETIILAMDVSGSMRATDVQPTRLAAAQAAAKQFIADAPRSTRIGIVSFAGTAALVQPPTDNRDELVAAIERFQLQRATAIGSGLVISLAALFPDAGITLEAVGKKDAKAAAPLADPNAPSEPKPFKPVPAGSYTAAAIILLTDGQRTTGPDPVEAAQMAAERGVRVFTVGIGTKEGEIIGFEGWSIRVRLDEETLKQIATITQGEYFYAGSAQDLKKVYETLNSRLVMERKETEITALFTAVAALLSLLAAGLSLLWFHRVL